MSQEVPQRDSSSVILRVALLASEWGSTKGGLSTLNRELAIQLAKLPNVKVTFLVPQGHCKDGDRREAGKHNVNLVDVERRPGYEPNDWLISPPQDLAIDVIIGHGVELGRQAQFIRKSHHCKWVQVVHIAAEELGMHKMYPDAISQGETKHSIEIELCMMADIVVPVGPKLAEVVASSLRSSKEDALIFPLTPGIFKEFSEVKQAAEDEKRFCVLVFGRGDQEDFQIKGFDIAAKAVSELDDVRLICVGAASGKEEEMKDRLVKEGISPNKLMVRKFIEFREELKKLFCEGDLLMMPSRTEAFGLTALEALSAGLPILACQNSGFGKALSEVPFGSSFVVDSDDAKNWANSIDAVRKRKRKTRLREAGILRSSYMDMYSWEEQCNGLVQMMRDIVQGAPETAQGLTGNPKGLSLSPNNQKDFSIARDHTDDETVFGDSEKENKRHRKRKKDKTVRGQSEKDKKTGSRKRKSEDSKIRKQLFPMSPEDFRR